MFREEDKYAEKSVSMNAASKIIDEKMMWIIINEIVFQSNPTE